MATNTRETTHQKKKHFSTLFPLLSLLTFTSIFFLLSQIRNPSSSSSSSSSIKAFSSIHNFQINNNNRHDSCDYSNGKWIYDESRVSRYDETCKEIFKGWNCIKGNKLNGREVVKWRWKGKGCDGVEQFDVVRFLTSHAHSSIGKILFLSLFVQIYISITASLVM